ncbi:MAG: helix-hairpin-helix domain-containing protein [Bacteroidales bacterium]|nr:helix-hairpin-helix domain-containing protein [Bacteroidales bacterium]
MNIRVLLLLYAGVVLCIPAITQPFIDRHVEIMESLAESAESDEDTQPDYESLLKELEYLHENPLNLNAASFSELQKLPFLTDFQIQSLLEYRNQNGVLLSLYELQLVHGFLEETILKMIPYVTVDEPVLAQSQNFKDIFKYGRTEITLSGHRTIEQSAGYVSTDTNQEIPVYPGDPWHYYAKSGFQSGNRIDLGVTMEKDPGETFFSGSNPSGFDFYSAHIMAHDIGMLKSVVAGDYRLQFGQGLTLWNGYAPGKSSLPLNVIKRQDPVKKFTSAEENNFFRGMAASLAVKKFTLTGFFSSKYNDANITDTLDTGMHAFSAFLFNGHHRTKSETRDEKSVRVGAFGGNITYRGNYLKVGFTGIKYQFNSYLEQSEKLYKAFDFYGRSLFNAGLDYTLTLHNMQIAGEVSYGHEAFATLHSAVFNAGKYASFSVLYRHFPASFYSLYSAAFAEGSGNSNESGFYLGTVIHPAPYWTVSAYSDLYRFPWLRYQVSAPSSGSDYMATIGYIPDKNMEMLLRFKLERKQVSSGLEDQNVDDLVWSVYKGLRYYFSYRYNDLLQLRSRIEYVSVNKEEEDPDRGFMFYQDVVCHFRKIPAILNFRYAWFDTDNYRSRIYMYEQQTLSSFTSTALYDEGYRTYIMMRYNFTGGLSCWIRLARTCYAEKTTIGSGYDLIRSNSRHEIKFQVLIRI